MNIIPLTGLPRSGSTLMMYLLNQNPIFEIYPDSIITEFLLSSKKVLCDNVKYSQIYHGKLSECFLNFCKSGTNSWVDTLVPKDKFLLDKSRQWMEDLDFFFKVYPNLKLIVQIRDLRLIVNSVEKSKNNSFYIDKREYYSNFQTNGGNIQQQRIVDTFDFPFIRFPLLGLKELAQTNKDYKNNLFISKYEDLQENPDLHMKRIYEFLEIPYYQHDFQNIEQTDDWNDNVFQPYGDHKIRKVLDTKKSVVTEFDKEMQDKIFEEYYWFYEHFYPELVV